MEAKPLAVAAIIEFVFNLSARDRFVTHDAKVARSIAAVDAHGYDHRQPTVLDTLANVQPQRGFPQSGHSGPLRSCSLLNGSLYLNKGMGLVVAGQ